MKTSRRVGQVDVDIKQWNINHKRELEINIEVENHVVIGPVATAGDFAKAQLCVCVCVCVCGGVCVIPSPRHT